MQSSLAGILLMLARFPLEAKRQLPCSVDPDTQLKADHYGCHVGWEPMSGNLSCGYTLNTTNVASINHLIQFAAGTNASETLADTYFGLNLIDLT